MKDIRDVSDMVCGNDYKICYKDEKFNQERWVYGEVVNYNNSGVFLICDDKFVIIPHRAVIWMLPYGSTTQKKVDEIKKLSVRRSKKLKANVDSIYTITNQKSSSITTNEILELISKIWLSVR